MMDDENIQMLLDEIWHPVQNYVHQHHQSDHDNSYHNHGAYALESSATPKPYYYGLYDDDPSSYNSSKHTWASSPVSEFSLQSGSSSSSLFSGGHTISENGSLTPPPLDELKSQMPGARSQYPNILVLDSKITSLGMKLNEENSVDELGLCRNLSRMYMGQEKDDSSSIKGLGVSDQHKSGISTSGVEQFLTYGVTRGYNEAQGLDSSLTRSPPRPQGEMDSASLDLHHSFGTRMDSLLEPRLFLNHIKPSELNLSCHNIEESSPWWKKMEQTSRCYNVGNPSLVDNQLTLLRGLPAADPLLCMRQNMRENSMGHGLHLINGWSRESSNIRIPQGNFITPVREGGIIIEGEGLDYIVTPGFRCSKGQINGSLEGVSESNCLGKRLQLDSHSNFAQVCENARSTRIYGRSIFPFKYNSLEEVQGCIYYMAKDQRGCRFLRKIFDEGTLEDVQIIFDEIIKHVVELMMNPFGNYLMQKLLDVCNEQQIMQILLVVTEERGELVKISLNAYGTRVVQKLIETLRTKQQISLVMSALEPGFLALIKDLNGNHVVERCLQSLSNEDNEFIFSAAAKNCVNLATHQHGCCVLQRCIRYSMGNYRNNLVTEISSNSLLLSQHIYGNYVVQLILDMKIPAATSNLISQFEGNYVHLSKQKFSSYVVEKCLLVFEEDMRSRIIYELLSSAHFPQLLRDPHANYVIQKAVQVSQGPHYYALVEAIEFHKALLRNSPYSERIYAQKFLKKS